MFSNCLIEAIKAKIKNPKLKIKMIPPEVNNGVIHFYWTDGETVYHYSRKPEEQNNRSFLFCGKLKTSRLSVFESILIHRMYTKNFSVNQAIKLCRKYSLSFNEQDIKECYETEKLD